VDVPLLTFKDTSVGSLEQKPSAVFCVLSVRSEESARFMPIAPHFNDPEYWHQRAEEARVLAERMSNERTKKMMRKVADDYDDLALSARRRVADAPTMPFAGAGESTGAFSGVGR
jgi:hypothetical protein